MTNVFTQTFGNSAVSPSQVAYASYSFSTNLQLFWPQFPGGQPNPTIAARFMNLTATVNTGLNVLLPDAALVSTGYDLIIFNAGSYSFNVVDSTGGAIVTIPTGKVFYLINTNNTTQAGVWQVVPFGVGTSAAVASALAGAGLAAAAGVLNLNIKPVIVSTSYTLATSALATLQVWNGGSGTITLPAAATAGDGFIFALANNGSGSVTVTTSDSIDGASTSVFAQTQSAFIICDGTAWYTVGKGIANTFAVTLLNLNVAGSSDITETSAQAQNVIQQLTGAITANINVIVPNTVQLYYVYNNTSGNYTLTFKAAGGAGIQVAQGTHTILYCDGTNIVPGFTAIIGNSLTLPPGSAAAPSLNFQGNTTTGIFSSNTNHVSITSQGTIAADFSAEASAVNYLGFVASSTASPVGIAAVGSDTNVGLFITGQGTGPVTIASAVLTGAPTATTAASNDNSTRIATTAFVKGQATSSAFSGSSVTGTNAIAVAATSPNSWALTDGNLITFTPVNVNTGNVTLNVLGTGALPIFRINFSGVGNVNPGDVNPISPLICQYNATGGYYLALNLQLYGLVNEVSTAQTVTFANNYTTYVATTNVSLTLAHSTTLLPWFSIELLANGGSITLNINAADKINNGTTGASVTIPQGGSGRVTTDSNGNFWLEESGIGTVSALSVTPANGFAGTVSNPTTTPAITLSTTITGLLKGNGTAISAATAGTDYQAAGNYITALTGDAAASGPGSAAITLASVNSNVGTFNNANITVNAKGLITAASNGSSPVKAWAKVTLSGTTPTIQAQSNIASITRNSAGDFTVAFTTNMTDANYTLGGSSQYTTTNGQMLGFKNGTTPTISSFEIVTYTSNNTLLDPASISIQVIGN